MPTPPPPPVWGEINDMVQILSSEILLFKNKMCFRVGNTKQGISREMRKIVQKFASEWNSRIRELIEMPRFFQKR